jgi:hypothetical protein
LDKEVVAAVSAIPVDYVCDFGMQRGLGEKKVLRNLLKSMGMSTVAYFEKRAIQFGTKIGIFSDNF